jgi:hypothetical protein
VGWYLGVEEWFIGEFMWEGLEIIEDGIEWFGEIGEYKDGYKELEIGVAWFVRVRIIGIKRRGEII